MTRRYRITSAPVPNRSRWKAKRLTYGGRAAKGIDDVCCGHGGILNPFWVFVNTQNVSVPPT